MKIVTDLEKIPQLPSPIVLTMGNFDGVHLGHQKLLAYLKKRAAPSGSVAVLTFANHPAEVLSKHPPAQLSSLDEKIAKFKKAGVDLLILLNFTTEIAAQSYDLFLRNIKKKLPFSFLILGKGAAFGHAKEGDEEHVKTLQKELSFTAEYLEKEKLDGRVISSGWIREEKEKGNHAMVEKLLGITGK